MTRFFVTYEIVTPESAENGEAEEVGYVLPGGWHANDRGDGMTLREAMQLCCPQEDCGRWWTEIGEDRCDYGTGAVEARAIHPAAGITRASYGRVSRLLGLRRQYGTGA